MSVSLVNGSYDTSYISQVLGLSGTSSTTSADTLSGTTTTDDSSQDTVTISSAGSASSQLLELVQERASLEQARSDLVSSTTESGGSTDSIESQLDDYDEQISALDTQIEQLRAQAAKEQTENIVTYSKNTFKNNSSSQTDKLNTITGLSGSLSTAKATASVRSRLDREAKSLQAEIDADQARGIDTTDKESELKELEEKTASASFTLSASLNDINQKIMESNGDPLVELDYPTSTYTTTTDDEDEDATDTAATTVDTTTTTTIGATATDESDSDDSE